MSTKQQRGLAAARRSHASIFAALGDETRLSLLAKLCAGTPQSIVQLTEGTRLTRQAISKHLRVLEEVGLVDSMRVGRESQYAFTPQPLGDIKLYIDEVSELWDQALGRLKSFVED